jgi:hypothetical protein
MPYTRDEGIWSKRNWIVIIGLVAGIINAAFGLNIGEETQVEIANFIESGVIIFLVLLAQWSKRSEKRQ